MGEHEATKLVTKLHTHSEKLQSSVIQKDMDHAKLVSTDQSLELVKCISWKTILSNLTIIPLEQIPYLTVDNTTTIDQEQRKQTRKTIKICTFSGEKVPRTGCCKACNVICNLCSKKGHFGKVCESIDPKAKEIPSGTWEFHKRSKWIS